MRLKDIRIKNNFTQGEIANILNVKRNTYSMWETENDIIPLKKLIKISEYFNVSIDYILELTDLYQYDNIKKFDYNLYLKRIKLVRKNNHTSQKELANYLNTTNSVISRYESGKTFILTLFLKEYAIFFNVSCDYLLGKKENETRI